MTYFISGFKQGNHIYLCCPIFYKRNEISENSKYQKKYEIKEVYDESQTLPPRWHLKKKNRYMSSCDDLTQIVTCT